MVASVNASALECALIAPVTTQSNAKLLRLVLNQVLLHCISAGVYGGTSYMLCHCYSFQNMSFCAGNLRMYDLYRTSNMKTRFLILNNLQLFIGRHCFKSWALINVVICFTYIALLLIFVTFTGGIPISISTQYIEGWTSGTASFVYRCSRSKPCSHFFVHPFRQIFH